MIGIGDNTVEEISASATQEEGVWRVRKGVHKICVEVGVVHVS